MYTVPILCICCLKRYVLLVLPSSSPSISFFFYLSISLFLSCSLFEFLTADVRCSIFSTQYSILNPTQNALAFLLFFVLFLLTFFLPLLFAFSGICFQSSFFLSSFLSSLLSFITHSTYQSTNLPTCLQARSKSNPINQLQSVVRGPSPSLFQFRFRFQVQIQIRS